MSKYVKGIMAQADSYKSGGKKKVREVKKRMELRKDVPPLPANDPGFEKFCKYLSYPAYNGLFAWQKVQHKRTWEAKYEKTLVHRKAGKSVLYNNKYQWAIQYRNFDVLLLGWTARYKEIAVYVYNFFEFHGLIDRDRRTSPFHFKTKNGGRFDAFLITSKETLGMHSEGLQDRYEKMTQAEWEEYKALFEVDLEDESKKAFTEQELKDFIESRKGTDRKLWIAIDDPIDISFKKERHKEEKLELHYNSTLYGIQPEKWSFTGTRKFEGDFFDFITNKFEDDPSYAEYVRGTHNPDGSLVCPEMFTEPPLPTYKEDIKAGKEDLSRIRKHVGEYVWWSDFQQDPRPVRGEVWETISTVAFLDSPYVRHYDLFWITIDRATTRSDEANRKKADFTGCVAGLREFETGRRIVTNDWTGYIDLNDLLLKINCYVIEHRKRYEHMEILIVVEKQGGGSDFVTLARNLPDFTTEDFSLRQNDALAPFLKEDTIESKRVLRVPNKIREYTRIVELHNTGEKEGRIRDRLNIPIKNREILFLDTLQSSHVVKELLNFPYCEKFDAIDAIANSEFVILEEYPPRKRGKTKADEILEMYEEYEKTETIEDEVEAFMDDGKPINDEEKMRLKLRGKSNNKRRTVF